MKLLVAQSCSTLCDPMDYSPPWNSVQGLLQARILEWAAIPSPGELPYPGTEPGPPTWWADSLPSEPPGKEFHSVFTKSNRLVNIDAGVC